MDPWPGDRIALLHGSQPQRERGHASERCSGSQPVGAAGGTHFAYRIIGTKTGVPLVLLQHFTGTMDYWDPAAVNGLAKEREVVVFDNTGGGASSRVWASDRMWRSSQPSDVGCRGNDQTLFGRGAARPPRNAIGPIASGSTGASNAGYRWRWMSTTAQSNAPSGYPSIVRRKGTKLQGVREAAAQGCDKRSRASRSFVDSAIGATL
jgi:hypothetical protein